MQFTYDSYKSLIETLGNNGYKVSDYSGWDKANKSVILRHDIDTDIKKAVEMADFEKQLHVQSTYFVLLTSDFYNVSSKQSLSGLHRIIEDGHKVGLHFDEMTYPDAIGDSKKVKQMIIREARILQEILDYPIKSVSYHRPSKQILSAELEIPGLINSYGHVFFHDFKYLSDSRRRWREPAIDIIKSQEYQRLHILTHAFWYHDVEEDIHATVSKFINAAGIERWKQMKDNITDLESIMPLEEI